MNHLHCGCQNDTPQQPLPDNEMFYCVVTMCFGLSHFCVFIFFIANFG